ncbi:hypothetical protein ACFQ2M_40645 [Kitasatospora saccharophila]
MRVSRQDIAKYCGPRSPGPVRGPRLGP